MRVIQISTMKIHIVKMVMMMDAQIIIKTIITVDLNNRIKDGVMSPKYDF